MGRKWEEESFSLLSPPELRGVLRSVLEQLHSSASSPSGGVELLKPFKMAHASPRVFWSVANHAGGDVATGLRSLLPSEDWSFLDEREKRLSQKATNNLQQAPPLHSHDSTRTSSHANPRPPPHSASHASACQFIPPKITQCLSTPC